MRGIFFALGLILCAGVVAGHGAPLTQSKFVAQWGSYVVVPLDEGGTRVQFIASGCDFVLALKTDGTLIAYGWNDYGQTTVSPALSNIVAVSAAAHTLALGSDATVVACGYNSQGQCDVPAGLTNVVAISAGNSYSMALKSDGTVVTWGWSSYGGIHAPPGLSNVVGIAAGDSASLALKSDGTVFCFGLYTNMTVSGLSNIVAVFGDDGWAVNSSGDLFHVEQSTSGVFIGTCVAGLSNVIAVSGNLILQADGTVLPLLGLQQQEDGSYTYLVGNPVLAGATRVASGGGGNFAFLTNGTTIQFGPNFTPEPPFWEKVRNLSAIAADAGNSFALKQDGTVLCWDSLDQRETMGLSKVTAIARGYWHSLALRADRTVYAWGQDDDGQCDVPAGLANIAAVAAGGYHSLALKQDGAVVGWGYDAYPQTNAGWLSGVSAISAGALHSLALMSNGTIQAWGYNHQGQCNVPFGLSNVAAIAAGGAHNLALMSNGIVVAWGYNQKGQSTVPLGLSNVVAIAAGGDHSLALRSDGTVVAWGSNDYGESTVPAGLGRVTAISAGFSDSMALVLPSIPTLNEQLAGNELVLSWPSDYSEFKVQYSDHLGSAWTDWPDQPANVASFYWITNPISSSSRFFRLKK